MCDVRSKGEGCEGSVVARAPPLIGRAPKARYYREHELKVGLTSWSFLPADVISAVRTIGESGIKDIELYGEVPHAYPDWVDRERLKDTLSAYGLTVTMHAPFTDLNIASPFQPVKGAIEKSLKAFIAFSVYLNARRVTFHPGSTHYEGLAERSRQSVISSIRLLVRASDGALDLNIENQAASRSFYYHPLGSTLESIGSLLSELDGVGLTLDTSHAHISRIDLLQFYRRFKSRITEVHVSDNAGTSDDHLAPGQGNAALVGLMKELADSDVLALLELNPLRLKPNEVIAEAKKLVRNPV